MKRNTNNRNPHIKKMLRKAGVKFTRITNEKDGLRYWQDESGALFVGLWQLAQAHQVSLS